MGKFVHACEGEIVCLSINTKIPYFNAPIYLENKVCSPVLQSPALARTLTSSSPSSAKSTRYSAP